MRWRCGADDGQVELRFTWWGDDDRARITEEAIALFEERNPNITVNTSYAAFSGYFERLATEVAGNNAPDVIQMDYAYLREYGDRGVLADLHEFDEDQLGTEGITPLLARSGEIDGRMYALPMAQNTHAWAYDEQAWTESGVPLPEAGWTWEDLLSSSQALTESTDGERYGTTDFGWSWETFQVWLRQQDKDLYTDAGEIGFDAADLRTYLELLDEFRTTEAATPAEVTAQIDGAITNSPLAMEGAYSEFAWDSATTTFFSVLPSGIALAPMPRTEGSERIGQFAKPGTLISIAAGSEHPEESAALVDFLLNDVDAGLILGTSRGMPVNDDVREAVGAELEGPDQLVYDYEEALADELEEPPSAPPPGNSALKREWQRLNSVIGFGQLSIDEAVEQFMERAEQEI
ncbi:MULTISPECIES: ABC transporter substrate-binding protein [Actinoalloteichus]|uniref:ABC-type sugar transport system, periplasmic component n=1 Tax=Actinoalloteichus fjordicus TaxID=1612552 RepID=A0AAC9LC60_9PSEU|nr:MULTISPECIES: extracellular solute-binding protein [Actinoalloteichus]APU14896.1 ABC-type sugar transport system, periplasmic component [Actinoalloteichus fjordicus]APU20866.1 ABC-type sugar transport system, periplasmic component [Actinoalloteichus sp. GBA129-24]